MLGDMHEASDTLTRIVERFGRLQQVCAIALGGSQATGLATADSDYDIYVFVTEPLSPELRISIGEAFSKSAQLVDYWGAGMEWDDDSGAHFDATFFDAAWVEANLERVILRCEPSLGWTTCFWHTIKVCHVLHDPSGWLARLRQFADVDYPQHLVDQIVALNAPVLRASFSSYRTQLVKAVRRGDTVSVNHRIAAALASIFDIIFAVNKRTHIGEKRLLDYVEAHCAIAPKEFRACVDRLLSSEAHGDERVIDAYDALVDRVDAMVAGALN